MSQNKRYTVTAALPYANGPVHIGHLAGVYVPADIYVRYLRMKGEDVVFLCGSDEHGVAITMRARKEGITPQDVVDKYHSLIKKSFAEFGVQFDQYSRTTSETHRETAQSFFSDLLEKGEFIEKSSEQFYDPIEKQFLADRYIIGTCPNCGYSEAYGDQCESCGSTLSPNELKDPRSALSGEKPIKKETTHWYLPLDKYQDEFLNDWIEEKKGIWRPNVYGQCKSWLDNGLQPRAITRDLDWGIPVPVEGAEGKVLYVWFDAPIGYISATKEWGEANGIADWEKYWKDEDSKLIHFIGKDNIVFHSIIFPAILKAHGEYILPEQVPANEFLNLEGQKISTSRNWAVWLHEYLEDFPGKQDVLRYVLTANAPETKDNDFTWTDFQTRNNSELVAILGNFVNRVLVLTQKYYDGTVPAPNALQQVDRDLLKEIETRGQNIAAKLEGYRFRDALTEYMSLARAGNKYLADEEPWKVIKTDEERVKTVMHTALQVAGALAQLGEPFLPTTAEKLRGFLNIALKSWSEAHLPNQVEAGHSIEKPSLLFEKIEDEVIENQLNKLNETKTMNEQTNAPKVEPQKENINFEDFMKLDLRVAVIKEAKRVPKTDKLLELKVDTGIDVRTVVSGIAEHFDPEKLIGQRVSMIVNLAPRKIRGVESQGMILMAENAEGVLSMLEPTEEMNAGDIIR
jgi:methionyl-tRNA synthetase